MWSPKEVREGYLQGGGRGRCRRPGLIIEDGQEHNLHLLKAHLTVVSRLPEDALLATKRELARERAKEEVQKVAHGGHILKEEENGRTLDVMDPGDRRTGNFMPGSPGGSGYPSLRQENSRCPVQNSSRPHQGRSEEPVRGSSARRALLLGMKEFVYCLRGVVAQ